VRNAAIRMIVLLFGNDERLVVSGWVFQKKSMFVPGFGVCHVLCVYCCVVWNQSESCHLPHELAGDKGRKELGTMDEELWMIPSFEIKKKIHSPQGISKMNG